MSNGDQFSTPVNSSSRFLSSIPRSSVFKRDSLAAELERGEYFDIQWRPGEHEDRDNNAHHLHDARPPTVHRQTTATHAGLLVPFGPCIPGEAACGGADNQARVRVEATGEGLVDREARRRSEMVGGTREGGAGGEGTRTGGGPRGEGT